MMFGGVLEKIQPLGIFVVGVLTVLSGLALLVFGYLAFVLGGFSTNIVTIIYPGLVFSIGGGALLLVDAALIFRGMRAGYFLSIISWFIISVVDVWGISSIGFFGIIDASALAYCVACLAYFLTHNVRTYFGT